MDVARRSEVAPVDGARLRDVVARHADDGGTGGPARQRPQRENGDANYSEFPNSCSDVLFRSVLLSVERRSGVRRAAVRNVPQRINLPRWNLPVSHDDEPPAGPTFLAMMLMWLSIAYMICKMLQT